MTLLEFASGYGCVTRHLSRVNPELDIVACDIHPEAISFLKTELRAETLLSRSVPEEFAVPRKFDAVFALSFFSHMPQRTWRRWLVALSECLVDEGLLIFTTHGETSRQHFGNPEIPESGIWFDASSEQGDLDVVEYGSTIVSTDFVDRQLEGLDLHLIRRETGVWWEHQDLYVARHRQVHS